MIVAATRTSLKTNCNKNAPQILGVPQSAEKVQQSDGTVVVTLNQDFLIFSRKYVKFISLVSKL